MATQRHKISLRVLKNISQVSAPFELFYDEFKVTETLYKDVLFLLSIAAMRCVNFSKVLYVFGSFMNNY